MPFKVTRPAIEPPFTLLELTDVERVAVLVEAKAHCAPSAWDRFTRSLDARGYPMKVTGL